MIQRLWYKLQDGKRAIRYAYQRVTRGYDNTWWWGLCETMPDTMVKVLTEFRTRHMGYPMGMTMKTWDATLEKMIEGWKAAQRMKSDEYFWLSPEEHKAKWDADKKVFEAGMKVFTKYFFNLWD